MTPSRHLWRSVETCQCNGFLCKIPLAHAKKIKSQCIEKIGHVIKVSSKKGPDFKTNDEVHQSPCIDHRPTIAANSPIMHTVFV